LASARDIASALSGEGNGRSAASASADSAAAARRGRRRVWLDRLATLTVRAGGFGIIASILAILIFIVVEVMPLIGGAAVTLSRVDPLPGPAVRAVVADEFGTHVAALDESGTVRVLRVADGVIPTSLPIGGRFGIPERFQRSRAGDGDEQLRLCARSADTLHAQIEGPGLAGRFQQRGQILDQAFIGNEQQLDVIVAGALDASGQGLAALQVRFADPQSQRAAALAAQACEEGEGRTLLRGDLPDVDVGFESVCAFERLVEDFECGLACAVAIDPRRICADGVRCDEEAVAAVVLADIAFDLCGAAEGRRWQSGGFGCRRRFARRRHGRLRWRERRRRGSGWRE